jgi:creatinine amidohydrolase
MLKHWNEMTAPDFAALRERNVVVLPVAATEQHGPHLPTGTDAFILDGILRAATARGGPVRGLALPLQPIGWSTEHGDLPGTLSFDAELLARSWVALGGQAARFGTKRLLILNAHGGNPPAIALAAMRLRTEHGLLVAQAHWEALAKPDEIAPAGASAHDWHAGWIETAMMLHLRPDLVRMQHAVASVMRHPEGLPPDGSAPWAWMTTDLSQNGVIGDPQLASAALGAQLLDRTIAGLADLLDRLSAADWPLFPPESDSL